MKTLFILIAFLLPVLAQAEDRYHGGCECFGQVNGIDIDDCARAGFGSGTGVRVQAKLPVSNGQCGAHAGIFSFLPKFPNKIFGVDIGGCCDAHDINYGTCGLPQDWSDAQISQCVQDAINQHTNPKKAIRARFAATTFSVMLETFGRSAYRAAQSTLCACSPCGAELARTCFLGGIGFPGPIQWPPWEPPPPLSPLQ